MKNLNETASLRWKMFYPRVDFADIEHKKYN